MQELELYREEEDVGGIGAEAMRSYNGGEEIEEDRVLRHEEEDAVMD